VVGLTVRRVRAGGHILKKYNHLTLENRVQIQQMLAFGSNFKLIGKQIDKDPTTVSYEIKKHTVVTQNPAATAPCPLLLKPPYVCNGCKKNSSRCGFSKQHYRCTLAHKDYRQTLSEVRTGIALNDEEFWINDRIISEGLKSGQHIYQIAKGRGLSVSLSTIYRHRKQGYLSADATQFPRVAKFKPRKQKYMEYVPKKAKIGRTFEDFTAFKEENNISSWVEMDTVIGRIGGKVILTLHFTFCNFMIGLLLNNKSSLEVTRKIEDLKLRLKQNEFLFGKIFSVILTDNGGEFSNIDAIEKSDEIVEAKLFFCDPYQSCQKAKIEKNHTMFRDIVPSGTSFDDLTQEKLNLVFCHVNSVNRASLNGRTPYEMFTFMYGEKLAGLLGIERIPSTDVIQSPKLLKQTS